MAVRTPLKLNGSNFQEMTSSEIQQIVDQTIYQYSINPSVTLLVVSSAGNISPGMVDTRLIAGSANSTNSTFPSAADTPDVSISNVTTFDKISQSVTSTTSSGDTSNIRFPLYYTGGNLRCMSLTDMLDTFIHPALSSLASSPATLTSAQGGTYTVSTSTSLSGHTLVSSTPIFVDTRANASAYTAAGIPEALDQPVTLTSYYIHRRQGADNSFTSPLKLNASDGSSVKQYGETEFEGVLSELVRHYAAAGSGSYNLRYTINGTGSNRGSTIADTRLNSSAYRQNQVSDTYYSQEHPSGSATNVSTWNLRIGLA